MTREERKTEIRIVGSHLYDNALHDLIHYMHRLEEIGCKAEARRLDTIVGKLETLSQDLILKGRK